MQVNGVENNNHSVPKSGSTAGYIAGSMLTDAVLGAGFGYSLPYVFKIKPEQFEEPAADILKKSDETKLKEAVKNEKYSLEGLLEKKNNKTIDTFLKDEPEVLKGFKNVLSKYKQSAALKQAALGAALCGAIGLVFGFINVSARNKAVKKAMANQQVQG